MTIDISQYLWHPPKELIPKIKQQKQLEELEFAGIVVRSRNR